MTRISNRKLDLDAATANLRELHPGDTVYTALSHAAASGMTRWIRAIVIRDNTPRDISWDAAKLIDAPVNTRNHDGVEIGGCGMDMGFHLVYSLSRALFRDGFDCIRFTAEGTDLAENDRSKWCPSNDHSNIRGLHTLSHHSDGGYALNHRWL